MLKFGTLVGLVLNNSHHQFKNVLWTLWHIGTKFVAIINCMFGRYLRVWGQCHLVFQRLFTKKKTISCYYIPWFMPILMISHLLFYVTLLLCHFEVMKNNYFKSCPFFCSIGSDDLQTKLHKKQKQKKQIFDIHNHYRETPFQSQPGLCLLSWAQKFIFQFEFLHLSSPPCCFHVADWTGRSHVTTHTVVCGKH